MQNAISFADNHVTVNIVLEMVTVPVVNMEPETARLIVKPFGRKIFTNQSGTPTLIM